MPRQVAIYRNVELTDANTGGQTSTVGEPSLANNGKHVLFTGNWYAARSANDGVTWTMVDPFRFLPATDGGFCCDQTVHYDQSRDVTIWLLQYVEKNNTNSLRLAVKPGPLDTTGGWKWWDLKPFQINPAWAGEWFDYNHAALSNNYLYVGTNAFRVSNDSWTRSVLFRIPLDSLRGNTSFSFDMFVSTENFSLRCVQGATDVMYFASHNSNKQLRLFEWRETSSSVTSRNAGVTPWVDGDYVAPGPGGANWLSRCDSRITGAWVGNGTIGFMWTANGQGAQRPFPFVRVARFDAATKSLRDEPDIWSAASAYAYPEACSNVQGTVGVTLFGGGGNRHPTHLVGFRDDVDDVWRLAVAGQSTHSPSDGKWGDYLSCRRHSPDGLGWVASGYTLKGSGAQNSIVPRYVHYGVQEHQPSAARWLGV